MVALGRSIEWCRIVAWYISVEQCTLHTMLWLHYAVLSGIDVMVKDR
jgi:hypothetical protein